MSLKLKPISQQVIVVTGASSGIGLVTARSAARLGARVLLVARGEAALRRAVSQIEAAGGVADCAVADVGDADALARAAAQAIDRWGRIDTWVNVAGVGILAKLVDTPLDEHERLFKTNYFGAVNGATLAVRHLRRQGGAIVNVSSIMADLPTPMMGAYAASKEALKSYTQTLRLEVIADALPISVTLVKPSAIDTPFAEHQANHTAGKAVIPRPTYDPQLVADAILDAAAHPRRKVTVGGVGRLQALVGLHFPALLEKAAGLLAKLPVQSGKPNDAQSSLFSPVHSARERSGSGATFHTSVYTAAKLHPVVTAMGLAAAAGVIALAISGRNTR